MLVLGEGEVCRTVMCRSSNALMLMKTGERVRLSAKTVAGPLIDVQIAGSGGGTSLDCAYTQGLLMLH